MEFDRELFRLRAELEQNSCHLADVRDAKAALDREWDALQLQRADILNRIGEIAIVDKGDV